MNIIVPRKPLPGSVRAFTTTRAGGVSQGAFRGLNLAMHVPDEHNAVLRNQQELTAVHNLPHAPRWLSQVHGSRTVDAKEVTDSYTVEADAVYTDQVNVVCAVMSADCLPLVLYELGGREVAAVHAGWKGLLDGVVESAVRMFSAPAARLGAWIGPGISNDAYAISSDLRQRFLRDDSTIHGSFRLRSGRWHADLYAIAERRLRECGVTKVSQYSGCTYGEPQRFYSYRRDGITGRMATLVWIKPRSEINSAT